MSCRILRVVARNGNAKSDAIALASLQVPSDLAPRPGQLKDGDQGQGAPQDRAVTRLTLDGPNDAGGEHERQGRAGHGAREPFGPPEGSRPLAAEAPAVQVAAPDVLTRGHRALMVDQEIWVGPTPLALPAQGLQGVHFPEFSLANETGTLERCPSERDVVPRQIPHLTGPYRRQKPSVVGKERGPVGRSHGAGREYRPAYRGVRRPRLGAEPGYPAGAHPAAGIGKGDDLAPHVREPRGTELTDPAASPPAHHANPRMGVLDGVGACSSGARGHDDLRACVDLSLDGTQAVGNALGSVPERDDD